MQIIFKPGIILISFVFFVLISVYGQDKNKELLIGQWSFQKFEFNGRLAGIDPQQKKDANNSNKGLIISFSFGNKYNSDQRGGMEINNARGTYKLLGNDKLVIMGDTSRIIQLDKSYLKLYSNEERPLILFKESYDGE